MSRKRQRKRYKNKNTTRLMNEFAFTCDHCRSCAIEELKRQGIEFIVQGISIVAFDHDAERAAEVMEENCGIYEPTTFPEIKAATSEWLKSH